MSAASASALVAVAVRVAVVAGWRAQDDRGRWRAVGDRLGARGDGRTREAAVIDGTRTRMRSPRSPLPAVARLSVLAVAPAMSVPLRVHW